MARMYDEIMAGRFTLPWYVNEVGGVAEDLAKAISGVPVVVIDNVAEYYYRGSDKPVWRFADGDFPNLAPPLERAWFEFRIGSPLVNYNGSLQLPDDCSGTPPHSIGMLFGSERRKHGWDIWSLVFSKENRRAAPIAHLVGPEIRVDPQGVYIPEGEVTSTGERVARLRGPSRWLNMDRLDPDRLGDDTRWQALANDMLEMFKVVALAITFMHCKNVSQKPVSQPAKLSKKWVRKTGKPLITYRVLDIDPVGPTPSNHSGATGAGSGKALHICRGHFATYTEEAPLFGRVTGTFWKPQHVRGSGTNGVVVKDYRVLSP